MGILHAAKLPLRAQAPGGRRDAIVLGFEITGIRSPAAGATDGTGSNEAARVSLAPRRRGCALDSSPARGARTAVDACDRISYRQGGPATSRGSWRHSVMGCNPP